ncbi:MAG: hypothetical protein ABIK92_18670 [Pseudomonadota bacterium]
MATKKIKEYGLKVISGFFSGIGFAIAIVLILSIQGYITEKFVKEAKEEIEVERFVPPERIEFDENSGLIITNHESQKYEKKFVIIGQVKNGGENSWRHVSLDAELFNSEKKFVDRCSTYISGTMKPNELRNFIITCGGCDDAPLIDFNTYEVNVVDAFYTK